MLFRSAWTKGRAPNVQAITERFNKVTTTTHHDHLSNHNRPFNLLSLFPLSFPSSLSWPWWLGGGCLRPQVCFWVATEIITMEDHAMRIEVLSRLIQVALV